jgi:hypothetical protein
MPQQASRQAREQVLSKQRKVTAAMAGLVMYAEVCRCSAANESKDLPAWAARSDGNQAKSPNCSPPEDI